MCELELLVLFFVTSSIAPFFFFLLLCFITHALVAIKMALQPLTETEANPISPLSRLVEELGQIRQSLNRDPSPSSPKIRKQPSSEWVNFRDFNCS